MKESYPKIIPFVLLGVIVGLINAFISYFIFIAGLLVLICGCVNFRYGKAESRFLVKSILIMFFLLSTLSIMGKLFGPYPS